VEAEVAPRGPRGAPRPGPKAPRAPRAGPRAVVPRAGVPRAGPQPKEPAKKRGFPFERKTTERELEELQKRREPESIELYQLSKDSLIDLAKKAGILNPSSMNKLQLIQAIQKSKITKDDVTELKVQNEVKNAEAIEYAKLAESGLRALPDKQIREYAKRIQANAQADKRIPKLKFEKSGGQTIEDYVVAIVKWEANFLDLEERKQIYRSLPNILAETGANPIDTREDLFRRGLPEDIEGKYQPRDRADFKDGIPPPNIAIPGLSPEGLPVVPISIYPQSVNTQAGLPATPALRAPGSAQPGAPPSTPLRATPAGRSAFKPITPKPDIPKPITTESIRAITPSRTKSSDIKDKLTVKQLEEIQNQLIAENPEAKDFIEPYTYGKKPKFIESIKNWIRKTFEKAPAAAAPAAASGVDAEQKGIPADPEQGFVSEGVDINTADEAGNQENKNEGTRLFATANASTGNLARQGDPGFIAPPAAAADGKLEGEGKHKKQEKFGIDNHSIDRFLSKYGDEYLGCIAHDEIPSKIYPKIKPRSRGFFVINTDPSWKSGEHWQCVFFDARPNGSNSIEFYDSFADPIDPKMQADLKGIAERLDAKTYLKLKENRIKQQHDDSDNCGYFCMNFITSRMRGKGFPEASGFDESVKGESDIHRFKKMNGFGFLPSFGSIASTFQRPLNTIKDIARSAGEAAQNTAQRVRNVGSTIGNIATNIKETIFFPEKKLPSSIQPLFEKYKNFKIISFQIRREPILAFVDKFINFISFGKFNEAKKNLGYDKMFHLSLILQLEPQSGAVGNGPKLLIEKNERINMTLNWKDGNQVQYFPASGSIPIPGNPTLGEFYDRTLKAVGDHQFFTYNAFAQNCQAFISDLLRSNNALSDDARNFVMQDAQTVIKQLPFYVSKIAQFSTDTAGRIRQFFGFGHIPNSKDRLRKQKYEIL